MLDRRARTAPGWQRRAGGGGLERAERGGGDRPARRGQPRPASRAPFPTHQFDAGVAVHVATW
jgi:hypothetical protein